MPTPLKRAAGYGWSYLWAKGQRSESQEYKDGMDKIKWSKTGTDGWEDGKNRFGRTKRKVF